MEPYKRTNIANGILTSLVLVSGITICAIMAALVRRFYEFEDSYSPSTAGWAVIFAYLIPGIVGLLATFRKVSKWYVAQSVLMILNLIGTSVFFVYQIYPLLVMSPNIYGLKCGALDCPSLDEMYRMVLALVGIYILSWIASLSAFFTSVTIGCGRQTKPVYTMRNGVSEHGYVRSYAHTQPANEPNQKIAVPPPISSTEL